MVNIDCMDDVEMLAFWFKYQGGRNYRELFPQGGNGSKTATADLANYAANKATAWGCRERGDIVIAQYYEDICSRIYRRLPPIAQW